MREMEYSVIDWLMDVALYSSCSSGFRAWCKYPHAFAGFTEINVFI